MEKEIFESIQEELGIADKVTEQANKVSEIILKNVSTQPKQKIKDGISTNTFCFKRQVFNKEIGFNIKNNYFSDVKLYYAYRKKYRKRPNKYERNTDTIYIEVDYINGWHDRETLEGALQHEFEHIFQNINQGYDSVKSEEYKTAAKNYLSNDTALQTIAKTIYFTDENEIYAFANQSYQALMQTDETPREYIKYTKLYQAYTSIKNGLEYLKNNGQKISDILKDFNTTVDNLSKRCEWAIPKYQKYIGRIIVKAEKDKLNESLSFGDDIMFP